MRAMNPRDLPADARQILETLHAPPRLVAHLTLVHDVAAELIRSLRNGWPDLAVDQDAVLFGAAIHDIGKVLHPDELHGPGHDHETDGPRLLERLGIPPERARFARTHATWNHETDLTCEDLLVALADASWKGQRDEELETLLASRIASLQGVEEWEAYLALDEMLERVAGLAEERLAWQRQFTTFSDNDP
jgi:putative nucleotidyltransferase with HDIG domain